MENPRMSKIMVFYETHYSVRQKIRDPGSISIRNMFPLHPVTPKRPESPYGAKKQNGRTSSFSVFLPRGLVNGAHGGPWSHPSVPLKGSPVRLIYLTSSIFLLKPMELKNMMPHVWVQLKGSPVRFLRLTSHKLHIAIETAWHSTFLLCRSLASH